MIVLVKGICQGNAKNDMAKKVEISYDVIKKETARKG